MHLSAQVMTLLSDSVETDKQLQNKVLPFGLSERRTKMNE